MARPPPLLPLLLLALGVALGAESRDRTGVLDLRPVSGARASSQRAFSFLDAIQAPHGTCGDVACASSPYKLVVEGGAAVVDGTSTTCITVVAMGCYGPAK